MIKVLPMFLYALVLLGVAAVFSLIAGLRYRQGSVVGVAVYSFSCALMLLDSIVVMGLIVLIALGLA